MVREAVADLEPSACETADTRTVGMPGTTAGAVYKPALVMAPVDALPPATPFTAQVTAELAAPLTVATNCCEPPASTVADGGDTDTEMAEGDGGVGAGVEEEGAALAELPPPPHPQPAKRRESAKSRAQLECRRTTVTVDSTIQYIVSRSRV